MIYKIRIIADIKDDVFRDIEIKKDDSLEDLHLAIIQSFDLPKGNMASFIRCNEDWEQLEEIPLENLKDDDLDDDDRPLPFSDKIMRHIKIENILKKRADRLIYLSDFINMYNFHIELLEEKEIKKDANYPLFVYKYGDSSLIFSKKSKVDVFFDEELEEDEDWDEEEYDEEEYDEELEENDEKEYY